MSLVDEILQKTGLKYEDLDKPGFAGERDTLQTWLEALSKNKLTLEDVKNHIRSMKDAVEKELTEYPEGKVIKIWFIKIRVGRDEERERMLKARLRNYMLLEAFLSTPERAKQALDRAVAGLVPSK
jgi:hypothetical protein